MRNSIYPKNNPGVKNIKGVYHTQKNHLIKGTLMGLFLKN